MAFDDGADVPADDDVASELRAALARMASTTSPEPLVWSDVERVGRHRRRVRVASVAVASVAIVVTTAAGAFAALPRDRADHVVTHPAGESTTVPAPSTTTTVPSSTTSSSPAVSASPSSTSTSTAPPTQCTSASGCPQPPPENQTPQFDDFTGSVTADADALQVEQGTSVELHLTNVTDHTISMSLATMPTTVGLYCGPVDADGRPTRLVDADHNFFYVTVPPAAPGEQTGTGGFFTPDDADLGTVTCEGVLIGTDGHWNDQHFLAVLANVAPTAISVTQTVPPGTVVDEPNTTSTTVGP
jgi:hypothetical protein